MIDAYKLFLVTAEQKEITGLVADLSWKDSVDTLGMELSFNRAYSDERYFPKVKIAPGDKLLLLNNTSELFRGIVVEEGFGNRFDRDVKAFDYAFYLNKSEIIIQFNGVQGNTAIEQTCQKINAPVGGIAKIPIVVKGIHKDKTAAEVIKSVLEEATKQLGTRYRVEARQGKLYVEKHSNLVVNARYQPASNLASFDVTKSASISGSRSIAEMKNAILVSSSGENSVAIAASEKDGGSVAKFGLLQGVESLDDANMAQARNVARNKLKELNKVDENFTLDMMGNDLVRAGRVLFYEDEINQIKGNFLVKSCTHTLKNGVHTMSCEMGVA